MTEAGGTLLLVGATSDIGRAVALRYGEAGWRILLAGRDPEGTSRNADDIRARTGAEVAIFALDCLETGAFGRFIDGLPALPDTVVCVVGELGEQARAERDPAHAALLLRTNLEGPALLLEAFAARFAARGAGVIVGPGAVAGDRGRASNYWYGAAKAGFAAFLSGLRNRLVGTGVHVLTVKPGFVRTGMTAGMKLPPVLTAEPAELGRAIYRAAEQRRRDVIYVRPIWRPVMAAIRVLPEAVFKRLRL